MKGEEKEPGSTWVNLGQPGLRGHHLVTGWDGWVFLFELPGGLMMILGQSVQTIFRCQAELRNFGERSEYNLNWLDPIETIKIIQTPSFKSQRSFQIHIPNIFQPHLPSPRPRVPASRPRRPPCPGGISGDWSVAAHCGRAPEPGFNRQTQHNTIYMYINIYMCIYIYVIWIMGI